MKPSVFSSLVLATLALLACGERARRSAPPPAPAGPPPAAGAHVVILVLDACRADKFGANGFDRPTTPAFDALAAEPESVLYLRQLSQAPHTRASTASLFTGVYPFQHGVFNQDDLTRELGGGRRYKGRRIADGYETLAERLRGSGYRTFATTSNPVIPGKDGYAQGFDRYLEPAKRQAIPTDEELVDGALAFLGEATTPAFAYVHASGCHSPTPPERRDADYFARFGGAFDEAALRKARVDPGSPRLKFLVRQRKLRLREPEVRYLETVYESVLRHVDRTVVARLVAGLRGAGLYDRTLLVVTADHGEELYDHGDIEHGRTVWDEVLRVPLAVKFPRGAKPARLPAKIERVTKTIDLYPSLARAVGAGVGPGLAGHDLFDPEAKPEIAFAQSTEAWAVVESRWKVVVHRPKRSAQLFDLAADPREQNDLAATHAAELRRLVRLGEGLQKVLPKLGAATPETELELEPETLEQLRALGYLQ